MKKSLIAGILGVVVILIIVLFFVFKGSLGIIKSNVPAYQCDVKDESCMELLRSNLETCTSSAFTVDMRYDSAYYKLYYIYVYEIKGVKGSRCSLTTKISNSSYSNLNGKSADCSLPMKDGKVQTPADSSGEMGTMSSLNSCKGPLIDELKKTMEGLSD
ncbi:MAG: hypothetical protein ABH840_01995 [Nanoarchaeota archaeon]